VEIERLGFTYNEVAQYDLEQLSPDRRVQVRDGKNYAPKEQVARYAVQMNMTEFPPIVVTSDGWIVDGNTRIGAKLLRKEKFYPALVLNAQWDGASDRKQDELSALAATLNAQNGMPLTAKETRSAVRTFVALGWLNEQIGRAIGVKASTVTAVRKEIDAQSKLDKVGLEDTVGKLRAAPLRALGAKDVLALNDEPYKFLAGLALDADLTTPEIMAAAREARETGSDTAALASLGDLRDELRSRISQKTLTGHGKPAASRQLRQHLGNVLKHRGTEQDLVETDPEVAERHIAALTEAIEILRRVRELQEAVL